MIRQIQKKCFKLFLDVDSSLLFIFKVLSTCRATISLCCFFIKNVTVYQLCDWSFTRQSSAPVKKKDCVGFAMWQKLSRDHPVEPWVDSLPYLPSPSLGLLSYQYAERLCRPLFAVFGGNVCCLFLDVCLWKEKTTWILWISPACLTEQEIERRFPRLS